MPNAALAIRTPWSIDAAMAPSELRTAAARKAQWRRRLCLAEVFVIHKDRSTSGEEKS